MAIPEEVYNSIRFIITALRELQMISIGNGHYFTAVQLMSAGIERLLKIPQFKCSYRSYKELY